ncbi:MAG: hypothetical protein ACQET8_15480 [Bacillota bacterium]
MNRANAALICILIGCIFLIITFSFSEPFILWVFLLGASIILNVVGTMLVLKTLKVTKNDAIPPK